MEFKGTKGKWVFNQEEMKIKGSGDIESLTVIANVSSKMDFSRGMGTQCANAKLISCAPEMLEMLIKVNDKLIPYFGDSNPIKSEIEQLIKKATEL